MRLVHLSRHREITIRNAWDVFWFDRMLWRPYQFRGLWFARPMKGRAA